MLGVVSGGFERFFQEMGTVTDHSTREQPPFIPDFRACRPRAVTRHAVPPDFTWPDA